LDVKSGPGVLDAMKADHPNDVNTCCNEMFIKWLSMTSDATWSQLVTALKRIGMNTVAENLNKQLRRGRICVLHNYCVIACVQIY